VEVAELVVEPKVVNAGKLLVAVAVLLA